VQQALQDPFSEDDVERAARHSADGEGYDLADRQALRRVAGLATELVPEFFGALADQGCITLHLHQQAGRNSHHIIEAGFKAFARALRQAIRVTGTGVPSTKGVLA